MNSFFVVGIICVAILVVAFTGMFFFVKFHLKRSRENRPLSSLLSHALAPYGFRSKYRGKGDKWVGQIHGLDFQIFDFAPISGGLTPNSNFAVISKASAPLFRIHVSFQPEKSHLADENKKFHEIDSDNAFSFFPDAGISAVLGRLVQPPVLTPMGISHQEIQLRLNPDNIQVDRLREILEDLAALGNFLQTQNL